MNVTELVILIIKLLTITLIGYFLLYKIFPKFSKRSQIVSFFIGILALLLLSIFLDSLLASLICFVIITCTLFIIDNLFINNDLTQDNSKKKNIDNVNKKNQTNKKSIIDLTEQQINKIYIFFVDNDLLANSNLEFIDFKESFLKNPLRLKMDVPSLREFFNNLKVQKNVKFHNIKENFLIHFINSDTNDQYCYKQFGNHSKSTSKLSDEIKILFKKF